MNRYLLLALALTPFLIASCGKPANDANTAGVESSVTENSPAGNNAPVEPTTQPATQTKPAVDLSKMPAELKHEAFQYFGLGRIAPVDMEMKMPDGTIKTGARIARLVKVEDGKATFEVEQTGGLADLQNYTYSVEKDGIYAVALSGGTLSSGRHKELPAKLSPGTTWTGNVKLKLNAGGTVESNDRNKVEGIQQVKTKAGAFDALVISDEATSKINGATSKQSLKIWLVKDIGPVKMTITLKGPGKPTQTTVEAVNVKQ